MIYNTITAAVLAASTLGAVSATEFVIQDGTSATMVMGVGVSSADYSVAAAAQNGVGAEIESFNGEAWTKEYLPASSLMDAAASEKVSVGVSMWQVMLSTDHSASYVALTNIYGLSQSASVFGDDGSELGLVGSWVVTNDAPAVNGVAYSADAGASWTTSAVPVGMVRYGSFPTSDTWYVTSGMWGDSVSSTAASTPTPRGAAHHLSSRLSIDAHGAVNMHGMDGSNSTATAAESSGWWGAISKTSDGGATWDVVFRSQPEDVYYFNGISCSSDTHCVAVAEGDVYVAYVTSDGGATWSQNFEENASDNMVSIMGAAWEDDSTGWIAGVGKDGRVLTGLFYKTTDGGATYALEQSLDNCYPIDMDFVGSTGAAACLDSSGTSGSVAMYMS